MAPTSRPPSDALARLRAVTPSAQTFSGGVARWDGLETSDELVARADRALYEAKNAGRDCVISAPDEPRYCHLAGNERGTEPRTT